MRRDDLRLLHSWLQREHVKRWWSKQRNLASIRAFEKAGFHAVRDLVDPADGETHRLMRVDRHAG